MEMTMKYCIALILFVSNQLNANPSTKAEKDNNVNHCETLKSDQAKLTSMLDTAKKERTELDKQIANLNEAVDKNSKACKDPNSKTCNRQMIDFMSQQRMVTQSKKNDIENKLISFVEQQKELDKRQLACP
jgi:hypothetical protein